MHLFKKEVEDERKKEKKTRKREFIMWKLGLGGKRYVAHTEFINKRKNSRNAAAI